MGQRPSVIFEAIGSPDIAAATKAVDDLLASGRDVNTVYNGKTALLQAAVGGHTNLVEALLDKGAYIEARDNLESTPLIAASFLGHKNTASVLLSRGADINAADKNGMTSLHWAVSESHLEIVELLISKGAALDIKNHRGQAPIDVAAGFKPKKRAKVETFFAECIEKRTRSLSSVEVEIPPEGLPGKTEDSLAERYAQLRVQRLAQLCKVWGLVKFMHPGSRFRSIDWDAALLKTIPLVNAAFSTQDFRDAINSMLALLDDPNTQCVSRNTPPFAGSVATSEREQPYVTYTDENVAILTATYHERLQDYQRMPYFMSCVKEANAKRIVGVVFDLRLRRGLQLSAAAAQPFKFMLYEAVRSMLEREVALPAYRQRTCNGYPQPWQAGSSFQWYSGLTTIEGETLTPSTPTDQQVPDRKPWVFLINSGTPSAIVDLLVGLQVAGIAKIVREVRAGDPEDESGIATFPLDIGESLTVHIRKYERINPDGTAGFAPDLVWAIDGDDAPALAAAVDVAASKRELTPVQRVAAGVYLQRLAEKDYADSAFPPKELRLLAFFRLWNVVQYFFAYKDLMDVDWALALLEFIVPVENCRNAVEYNLLLAELTAHLADSHVQLNSQTWNSYIGTHAPPVEVRLIDGKSIVTALVGPSIKQSGLALGAEIVSVEKVDVDRWRKQLSIVHSAATPQAMNLKVHQKLLAGEKDSRVTVEVANADGTTTQIVLTRSSPSLPRPASRAPFGVLPEGIGFIDTVNISPVDVEKAWSQVKSCPALILDVRGYPRGTLYQIAPRLTDKKLLVAATYTPALVPSSLTSDLEPSRVEELHYLHPSSQEKYRGIVVALISEETMSHAEHGCLYLEQVGATFIGSPSNGTNGNVASVQLPGAVSVSFTGLGVTYPNRDPLQRQGIVPHITVHQTVQGVKHGVDEIFNKAVEYLTQALSPPADAAAEPKTAANGAAPGSPPQTPQK